MSSQSPIVRTSDTLKLYFCRVCGQETFRLRLSGTMCEHSKNDIYPVCPISFTEDFLVKTSPLRAMEKAWMESEADFLARSYGSLAIYDHRSFSWKTHQRSLVEDWEPLPRRLPDYGMSLGGSLYPLEMSELRIAGRDGFLWRTPTAEEGTGGSQTPEKRKAGNHSVHLRDQLGGQPNPMWLEWLMGYEYRSGWTVLGVLETLWYRPRRGKRSNVSSASKNKNHRRQKSI